LVFGLKRWKLEGGALHNVGMKMKMVVKRKICSGIIENEQIPKGILISK
jgi:hypothetical protein